MSSDQKDNQPPADVKRQGFITYEDILASLLDTLPPEPVPDDRQPFQVARPQPQRFGRWWY